MLFGYSMNSITVDSIFFAAENILAADAASITGRVVWTFLVRLYTLVYGILIGIINWTNFIRCFTMQIFQILSATATYIGIQYT